MNNKEKLRQKIAAKKSLRTGSTLLKTVKDMVKTMSATEQEAIFKQVASLNKTKPPRKTMTEQVGDEDEDEEEEEEEEKSSRKPMTELVGDDGKEKVPVKSPRKSMTIGDKDEEKVPVKSPRKSMTEQVGDAYDEKAPRKTMTELVGDEDDGKEKTKNLIN